MRYLKIFVFTIMLTLFVGSCTRVVDSVDFDRTAWKTYPSSHYLFHVRPHSAAESSIQQIMQEQEWAYQRVKDTLGYRSNQKIQLYIYSSRQDLGTPRYTGKAYPEMKTIEAIYSPTIKSIGRRGVSLHELTHLAAYYSWCSSPLSLFGEGLAVWMDDYWKAKGISSTDLFRIAKIRLQRENLPTIGSLIKNWEKYPANISYPAAGAFAKYLIENYGLAPFRKLYCRTREDNFEKVFIDIYEKRAFTIENEFRRFLKRY